MFVKLGYAKIVLQIGKFMEAIEIKSIYDFKKKILSVNEIQEYFKIQNYIKLVEFIEDLSPLHQLRKKH